MVSGVNGPLLKNAQCSGGPDPTSLEHTQNARPQIALPRAQVSAAPAAQPDVRRADRCPLCPTDGPDPLRGQGSMNQAGTVGRVADSVRII